MSSRIPISCGLHLSNREFTFAFHGGTATVRVSTPDLAPGAATAPGVLQATPDRAWQIAAAEQASSEMFGLGQSRSGYLFTDDDAAQTSPRCSSCGAARAVSAFACWTTGPPAKFREGTTGPRGHFLLWALHVIVGWTSAVGDAPLEVRLFFTARAFGASGSRVTGFARRECFG
jgi:hypothetical protein